MVGTNAGGVQSIRDGNWKYIDPKFTDGAPKGLQKNFAKEAEPALYDLSKDPAEETNMIADHPEVVQRLQKVLEEYRKGKGSK